MRCNVANACICAPYDHYNYCFVYASYYSLPLYILYYIILYLPIHFGNIHEDDSLENVVYIRIE